MIILAEIGQQLREARNARNRSIEDLARETHLKPAHIIALEAGNESGLPEPVYVKSFIRKYAQAVGLPGDELARRYWETRPLAPAPVVHSEFSAPWWILPAVLLVFLLGGLMYAYMVSTPPSPPEASPLASIAPESASLAPSTSSATQSAIASSSAVAKLTATISATASPGALALPMASPSAKPTPKSKPTPKPISKPTPKPISKPTPTTLPLTASRSATPSEEPSVASVSTLPELGPVKPLVLLKLLVIQRSWVQVRRQGHDLCSRILLPGESRSWPLSEPLDVVIGNGAGVQVSLGEKSLGVLGSKGQLVRRIFKREEP